MSVFPDPEPTQAYAASLVRGRLHAARLSEKSDAARVEALVRPRLDALFVSWGHRIGRPRLAGFALAFDLRTPAELAEYLAQRFWRGAIVFGAGERTVRYRLNASFEETDVDRLFETIRQSLAWLEAHPGKKAPDWEDLESRSARAVDDVVVREALRDEAVLLMPQILAIEMRIYEPARRDPEARLRAGFTDDDGVAIVAERVIDGQSVIVGYAIGVALERVPEIMGPDRDSARGRQDSIYSVAVTVDPALRNSGLGRRLKQAQLRAARAKQRADGTPRYRFCVGRNRVGVADAMGRINDAIGYATQAVEISIEKWTHAYAEAELGRALLLHGEVDRAEQLLTSAYAFLEQGGARRYQIDAGLGLLKLYETQHRQYELRELIAQLLSLCNAISDVRAERVVKFQTRN